MGVLKRVWLTVCVMIFLVWTVLPIYWFVNMSLMREVDISSVPPQFIATSPSLDDYLRVLGFTVVKSSGEELLPSGLSGLVVSGIGNSLIAAVATTAITLLIACPVAYAFGRYRFRGKNGLFGILLGSRALPPVSIIIPYYAFFSQVRITGTLLGLIITYSSITVPIVVWVLMGFFGGLPIEIERGARVDGCTRWQVFWKVVVPMGSAGVAACGVLTFLLCWNEFLFAWILTTGSPAQTLPPIIPGFMWIQIQVNLLSAATVIGMIPAIVIAIVFARYLVQVKIVDPMTTVPQ